MLWQRPVMLLFTHAVPQTSMAAADCQIKGNHWFLRTLPCSKHRFHWGCVSEQMESRLSFSAVMASVDLVTQEEEEFIDSTLSSFWNCCCCAYLKHTSVEKWVTIHMNATPFSSISLEQLDFVLKPRSPRLFSDDFSPQCCRRKLHKSLSSSNEQDPVQDPSHPPFPSDYYQLRQNNSSPVAARTGELTASTAWIRYVHSGTKADQLSNNCLTSPNCFIHTEHAHMLCWEGGGCISTDAPWHESDLCVCVCVCELTAAFCSEVKQCEHNDFLNTRTSDEQKRLSAACKCICLNITTRFMFISASSTGQILLTRCPPPPTLKHTHTHSTAGNFSPIITLHPFWERFMSEILLFQNIF